MVVWGKFDAWDVTKLEEIDEMNWSMLLTKVIGYFRFLRSAAARVAMAAPRLWPVTTIW